MLPPGRGLFGFHKLAELRQEHADGSLRAAALHAHDRHGRLAARRCQLWRRGVPGARRTQARRPPTASYWPSDRLALERQQQPRGHLRRRAALGLAPVHGPHLSARVRRRLHPLDGGHRRRRAPRAAAVGRGSACHAAKCGGRCAQPLVPARRLRLQRRGARLACLCGRRPGRGPLAVGDRELDRAALRGAPRQRERQGDAARRGLLREPRGAHRQEPAPPPRRRLLRERRGPTCCRRVPPPG